MANKERSNRSWNIKSIIAIAIYTSLNIYVAFSLKDILDLVEVGDIGEFKTTVIRSGLVMLGLGAGFFLKSYTKRRYLASEMRYYSKDLYSKVLHSNREKNAGETISLLTNDLELAISSKINMFFGVVENSILFVFALGSLVFVDLKLALVVLVVSFILTKVPDIFTEYLADRRSKQVEDMAQMNSQLSNSLTGIDTIKSYSMEDRMKEDIFSSIDKGEESVYQSAKSVQIANNTIFGLTMMAQTLVLLLAGVMIAKGYLKTGVLLLVGQLMSFIMEPISQFLGVKNEYVANKEVLENITSKTWPRRTYGTVEKHTFDHSIELKNIYFSYGDKVIFKDLNMTIEKGKKYVIMGRSGEGKSTLFNLITGNISPDRGQVLIDGIDIKSLSKESIKSIFQKINQDVFMFNRPIQYNVSLYDTYSIEEYNDALKKANIYDKIESLPSGSSTTFKETEDILSGGEKQRIQLARAFIKDREIYLLDEVTSNLDHENTMLIEDSIKNLDKTVLAICHKLDESLDNYDTVLELVDGKAVEIK